MPPKPASSACATSAADRSAWNCSNIAAYPSVPTDVSFPLSRLLYFLRARIARSSATCGRPGCKPSIRFSSRVASRRRSSAT